MLNNATFDVVITSKEVKKLIRKPKMAKGTTIPESVALLELKEAKEKALLKQQRKHDFLVATYGIIGSALASIIIWLITK
ncbi:hypothetical protein SDC9_137680 [bioreactor metagenome]|uniref:Uncharacterized protein n=1 Tax=bioreactor metagenome TaxID=1076179 RepID=A0A645DMP0_9ZZZZ